MQKTPKLLPYPVIAAAASGNINALYQILHHYDGYIAKLSTRIVKGADGKVHCYVDEEMRNRLQIRLITRTLKFRVA